MRLPVIELDAVWHVGTMDPSQRGALHSVSFEGSGLSVSLCPAAWTAIARLGGSPLQRLAVPGASFLDFLALDDETLATIQEWASDEGLMERRDAWKAWRYDDEDGRWSYTTFATEKDAHAEIEDDEDDPVADEGGPPGGSRVQHAIVHALTREGVCRASGYGDGVEATDVAAMFWVEDVLAAQVPGLAGIWWREDHDPGAYSAPRGAVVPSLVPGLAAKTVGWDDVPDDEELLDAMPETRWIETEPASTPGAP